MISIEEARGLFKEAESRGDRETAIAAMAKIEELQGSPALTPEEEIEVNSNIFQRIEKKHGERVNEVTQTLWDMQNKVITPEEGALQFYGKGMAGASLDVVGEVATSAIFAIGDGLSAVIPDTVEKPTIEAFKKTWDWVTNTDAGKKAAEALEGGVSSWNEFKKYSPRSAKNIESLYNIGLMFAPAKTKKNASPTSFQNTANVLDDLATQQLKKKKVDFLTDLVSPKRTPTVRIEEVARSVESGIGPFKKTVVTPSKAQTKIADVLMNVKGISPKNSLVGNRNIIQSTLNKRVDNLDRWLTASKIPVSKTYVNSQLDDVAANIARDYPVLVGNVERYADDTVSYAKQLIDNSDGTASGLLRARKDLDAWVRRQKPQALAADKHDAMAIAQRQTRTKINELIDDAIVKHQTRLGAGKTAASKKISGFDNIRKELKDQSRMIEALDNIDPKAAIESETAIGRLYQDVARVMPLSDGLVKDLSVIMGMTYYGAAKALAPYMPVAITAAVAGKAGTSMATAPWLKQGGAKLLRAADRAINTSTNPSMIRQLRADRAVLLEVMKEIEANSMEEKAD